MRPDAFLLSNRIGRWRWPWALLGTALTILLIVIVAHAATPIERAAARAYGAAEPPAELLPARLDTYLGFMTFALALTLGPALALALVHGRDPRSALGPDGRIGLVHLAKGGTAMILVLALNMATDLIFDPSSLALQPDLLARLPWVLLALPVILLQSFSEEYLFKGYLVRTWGAVLPWRSLIVAIIAGLFTLGHSVNEDIAQDLAFHLVAFFFSEIVVMAIFLRTGSLGAVTGVHWMNNVWAMCLVATLPGQSGALALATYTDPVLSAGGSRLLDPWAYVEVVVGFGLLWALLAWPPSPLCVEKLQLSPPPDPPPGSPSEPGVNAPPAPP